MCGELGDRVKAGSQQVQGEGSREEPQSVGAGGGQEGERPPCAGAVGPEGRRLWGQGRTCWGPGRAQGAPQAEGRAQAPLWSHPSGPGVPRFKVATATDASAEWLGVRERRNRASRRTQSVRRAGPAGTVAAYAERVPRGRKGWRRPGGLAREEGGRAGRGGSPRMGEERIGLKMTRGISKLKTEQGEKDGIT